VRLYEAGVTLTRRVRLPYKTIRLPYCDTVTNRCQAPAIPGAQPMRDTGTGEATMAQEKMPKFEIPAEMRQMAEQSVEQARKAFDGFIAAAQQAVSTFEGQTAVAQAGARDVGKKAMTFAEQNVANSFEFAHNLVRAKDIQEILRLHSEFIRAQMEALSNQARELGESASRAAKDAGKRGGS
jgi:phasin